MWHIIVVVFLAMGSNPEAQAGNFKSQKTFATEQECKDFGEKAIPVLTKVLQAQINNDKVVVRLEPKCFLDKTQSNI